MRILPWQQFLSSADDLHFLSGGHASSGGFAPALASILATLHPSAKKTNHKISAQEESELKPSSSSSSLPFFRVRTATFISLLIPSVPFFKTVLNLQDFDRCKTIDVKLNQISVNGQTSGALKVISYLLEFIF